MNRFYFFLMVFIIASNMNVVSAQESNKKTIVLLDPGHGGLDSGAIGVNGILEKDFVLKVATEVIRLNRELYNDTLDIYLTRYSDTLISLGHRTKLAKILQADVFVSIHCNQAMRKAAQGVEVYVQKPSKKTNHNNQMQSEQLSRNLVNRLEESLGYKNRGIKYDNFQVLRETKFLCPSVLLEPGFISNPKEADHNSKQSTLAGLALIILQTLLNFDYAGNL